MFTVYIVIIFAIYLYVLYSLCICKLHLHTALIIYICIHLSIIWCSSWQIVLYTPRSGGKIVSWPQLLSLWDPCLPRPVPLTEPDRSTNTEGATNARIWTPQIRPERNMEMPNCIWWSYWRCKMKRAFRQSDVTWTSWQIPLVPTKKKCNPQEPTTIFKLYPMDTI